MSHHHSSPDQKYPDIIEKILPYWPLISLTLFTALAAWALERTQGGTYPPSWMHNFMGLFLVFFSLLKFWDLSGFTEGFKTYDLVSERFPYYAITYPFIELILGLGFLAHFLTVFACLLTLGIMSINAFSVIQALTKGLDTQCACMGTVLKVPLSTVTLTENLTMGVMALMLLVH